MRDGDVLVRSLRYSIERKWAEALHFSGGQVELPVEEWTFIEKPFTPDGLVYKFHQVLNGKG